jgi:ABC-2 type transport system ATP-binding protein
MTILLTTHYLDEAERLCDRVAIVHEGRIAALDSPRALLSALGDEIVEVRLAGDARDALDDFRARGIANGDAFVVGTSVTVPVRGMRAGDVVSAISRTGRRTESVSTRAPTLDDVYLKLTGSRLDEAA